MTATAKICYCAIAIFILVAVAFGVVQNRTIDELRRQIEQLQPKATEVERLKQEIQKMKGVRVDINQLAALRSEKAELM